MNLSLVFVLAAALAMDAFAVALAAGIHSPSRGGALRMAGTFGFFQFLMPVAGWCLGAWVQRLLEAYDHWLAFGLLAFVGGKMLWEAVRGKGREAGADPTRGLTLLLLGIATSLDALGVGLSLALLQTDIWLPALIIGGVCFCFTLCGMGLGRQIRLTPALSAYIGDKAGFLGGLTLLLIGFGILREHGVFS
jgi:putative Mn2+ efflux pump MntP